MDINAVFNEVFPFWGNLDESQKKLLITNTREICFEKGAHIHDNSECSGVILVKKGCLRVFIMSEEGKDITLYRLHKGNICMLSASCVLQSITFDVFIDAEEDSECYIINGPTFSSVSEKVSDVKIYSLEVALEKFSDVMWVMQQILFMSIDKRLAIFLLDEATRTNSDTIALTHEQIAKYIGSAREVVSRMLKYFANDGIVESSRGGVKIVDKKRLRRLTF